MLRSCIPLLATIGVGHAWVCLKNLKEHITLIDDLSVLSVSHPNKARCRRRVGHRPVVVSLWRVVVGHHAVPCESPVVRVIKVELFGSTLHVPVYRMSGVVVGDVDAFDVRIPVGRTIVARACCFIKFNPQSFTLENNRVLLQVRNRVLSAVITPQQLPGCCIVNGNTIPPVSIGMSIIHPQAGERHSELVGRCGRPEVLLKSHIRVTPIFSTTVEKTATVRGDGGVVHEIQPTEAWGNHCRLIGLTAIGDFDFHFRDNRERGVAFVDVTSIEICANPHQRFCGGQVGYFPVVNAATQV